MKETVCNSALLPNRLAILALAISDASALQTICSAIESGRLSPDSTAIARASIASGSTTIEKCLRSLQEVWVLAGPALTPQILTLLLRASVMSLSASRETIPTTQVVWTGPRVEGSFLRGTREVVREIVRGAERELLLVGYWIAARDDVDGIIEETIAALAQAVERGVKVTVVVDERVRPDGRDNRSVLQSVWPKDARPPRTLTWRLPPNDIHLKLHAKVLVSDRNDALVTSANLTTYAMDRNMEMGVRIVGSTARDIATHFELLYARGVLEPFGNEIT